MQLYLASRIASNCVRDYVAACRRTLAAFVRFAPVASIEDLHPRHITDYLAARLRSGIKASTVRGDRAKLLAWVGWLTTEGYIEDRRWGGRVEQVRLPRPLVKALSPEQARQFLVAAEFADHRTSLAKHRDIAMIYLLLDTGLRESELLSLALSDVDVSTRTVRVRHGKGDKERVVWYTEPTAAKLKGYLRLRRQKPGQWLWITRDDTRPCRSLLLQIVKRIGRSIGLDVSVHQLRHTCATQMLRAGMSLPGVSAVLGHSQLRSTQRYLHLLNDDVRREYMAAGPVARLLG